MPVARQRAQAARSVLEQATHAQGTEWDEPAFEAPTLSQYPVWGLRGSPREKG